MRWAWWGWASRLVRSQGRCQGWDVQYICQVEVSRLSAFLPQAWACWRVPGGPSCGALWLVVCAALLVALLLRCTGCGAAPAWPGAAALQPRSTCCSMLSLRAVAFSGLWLAQATRGMHPSIALSQSFFAVCFLRVCASVLVLHYGAERRCACGCIRCHGLLQHAGMVPCGRGLL